MQLNQEEDRSSSKKVLSISGSLLLSVFSGLVYSFVTVLVKLLTDIHPALLLAYRYCASTSLVLPQVVLQKGNIFGSAADRILILASGILEGVGGFLFFISFRYLSLGEAAVLTCCYPAFVTIAAKIFLKESFGLLQAISVLAVTFGVISITDMWDMMIEKFTVLTTERMYGILAGLAASIGVTAKCLLMRKLKHIHYSVITFTTGMTAVVVSLIITSLLGGFRPNYKRIEHLFIILIGFLAYLSMLTFIKAVQSLEAGPISTIRASSDILFSFIWQVIIFDDFPNGQKILGAVLVTLSIILIGSMTRINPYLPKKCVLFC